MSILPSSGFGKPRQAASIWWLPNVNSCSGDVIFGTAKKNENFLFKKSEWTKANNRIYGNCRLLRKQWAKWTLDAVFSSILFPNWKSTIGCVWWFYPEFWVTWTHNFGYDNQRRPTTKKIHPSRNNIDFLYFTQRTMFAYWATPMRVYVYSWPPKSIRITCVYVRWLCLQCICDFDRWCNICEAKRKQKCFVKSIKHIWNWLNAITFRWIYAMY